METPAKKGDPTDTGAFGVFDYVVWVKGKNADQGSVKPGASAIFQINILGVGPFSGLDFLSDASVVEGDVGSRDRPTLSSFRSNEISPGRRFHAGRILGKETCLRMVFTSGCSVGHWTPI